MLVVVGVPRGRARLMVIGVLGVVVGTGILAPLRVRGLPRSRRGGALVAGLLFGILPWVEGTLRIG